MLMNIDVSPISEILIEKTLIATIKTSVFDGELITPNSGLASKARLAASCEFMTLTSCTMLYTSFNLWRIDSEIPGVTRLVHSDTLRAKQGNIHLFHRSPWGLSISKPRLLHLTKCYVYFRQRNSLKPCPMSKQNLTLALISHKHAKKNLV
uniref:Uncharacterized protein n=1 Tax=Glossina palpalis gambiensis TaxID=67801 RepID=A0A1B0B5E2_9MUSC